MLPGQGLKDIEGEGLKEQAFPAKVKEALLGDGEVIEGTRGQLE